MSIITYSGKESEKEYIHVCIYIYMYMKLNHFVVHLKLT